MLTWPLGLVTSEINGVHHDEVVISLMINRPSMVQFALTIIGDNYYVV